MDAKGGRVLHIPAGRAVLRSAISADGRWQALIILKTGEPPCNGALRASEIRLREVSAGVESTLLACADPFFTKVEWLPSGKLLGLGPNCWACEAQSYQLALVEPATGEVQLLTDGLEVGAASHLSPDGKRLLVTGSKLRVYTIDGVLEREIVPPGGLPVIAAAWSPDGSSFAYIVGPRIDFN